MPNVGFKIDGLLNLKLSLVHLIAKSFIRQFVDIIDGIAP